MGRQRFQIRWNRLVLYLGLRTPEEVEIIEKGVKTLGVLWSQKEDSFQFKVAATKVREQTSKRKIMSDACKLFDPIGWLSLVTIVANIFIQSWMG